LSEDLKRTGARYEKECIWGGWVKGKHVDGGVGRGGLKPTGSMGGGVFKEKKVLYWRRQTTHHKGKKTKNLTQQTKREKNRAAVRGVKRDPCLSKQRNLALKGGSGNVRTKHEGGVQSGRCVKGGKKGGLSI